ncbi:CPNE7 protein, partial [Nyctibius bracteatus]|nr:CPNE7 protein [Nyctibius bracteatus]
PSRLATMSEAPEPSPQAPLAVLSKVELRVSCRHLLDRDTLNKSDPCVLLLMQAQGQWMEVGGWGGIAGTHRGGAGCHRGCDGAGHGVLGMGFGVAGMGTGAEAAPWGWRWGESHCTGCRRRCGGGCVAPCPFPPRGHLSSQVISEEISGNNGYVELAFRAKKLDDKDLFSKSDPFLEIYRVDDDGSEQLVYRTEVVKNNLSPIWEPFKVSLNSLCSCEEKRKLRCVVWDYDSRGKHDFIGEFFTTFEEMQKAMGENKVGAGTTACGVTPACCQQSPLQETPPNSSSGVGAVLPSLPHSLGKGWWGWAPRGKLAPDGVAGSGGRRLHPGAAGCGAAGLWGCIIVGLHHCGATGFDKKFSALGFGARIPPKYEVSHDFAINFNPDNDECEGIQGVVESYQSCLPKIQLYGPTNVAPIISKVARVAADEERTKEASQYFILLILTDGVVTDMADTREAIVRASYLPMSIIIVGVGNADFTDMQILDGDDGVLRSPRGEPVLRDIVQFVPFREFKNVPKQVVEYYSYKAFPPRCPQPEPPDPHLGSPQ